MIITIVCSFIGCFFSAFLYDLIKNYIMQKKKNNKVVEPENKREIPENIGRFADPLGGYDKYIDKNTKLYKSYVPKAENRLGGDINDR